MNQVNNQVVLNAIPKHIRDKLGWWHPSFFRYKVADFESQIHCVLFYYQTQTYVTTTVYDYYADFSVAFQDEEHHSRFLCHRLWNIPSLLEDIKNVVYNVSILAASAPRIGVN